MLHKLLIAYIVLCSALSSERKLIVTKNELDPECENCTKIESLLEALEYSFLSNESSNLELLDQNYSIDDTEISIFRKNNESRSLIFTNPFPSETRKFIILKGRYNEEKNDTETTIIFDEFFFTLNLSKTDLTFENLKFIFLNKVKKDYSSWREKCFICSKNGGKFQTNIHIISSRLEFSSLNPEQIISETNLEELSFIETDGYFRNILIENSIFFNNMAQVVLILIYFINTI